MNTAPESLSSELGWSDFFANHAASMDINGKKVVRVLSVRRNSFLVSDSESEWLCTAAGRLSHDENGLYPVTGDWVLVKDTVVTGVIPRRNMLSRGAAGTRDSQGDKTVREQPIAANIDTVFIVCGLDRDFNVRRIERYLTLVYNCGLSPVVVLTKADLHDDPEACAADVEAVALGVPVILSSMQDDRGIPELENWFGPGQTVAMLGSSGAGKSTLANMLYGSDVQITRAVSQAVNKGRHTTTSRDLIRMPQGGLLIDNPGIREIAFFEGGNGVDSAFPDIEALAHMCRFADCSHNHEPDCAVTGAVKAGELSADRLESYRKIQREMDYLAERQNKSADRIEKERWKDVALYIKDMKKRKKR